VPILITHAAVDDIEPPIPESGGYLACFNKHRHTFEQAANAKHQRGEFEESGVVVVLAGDLR